MIPATGLFSVHVFYLKADLLLKHCADQLNSGHWTISTGHAYVMKVTFFWC